MLNRGSNCKLWMKLQDASRAFRVRKARLNAGLKLSRLVG